MGHPRVDGFHNALTYLLVALQFESATEFQYLYNRLLAGEGSEKIYH